LSVLLEVKGKEFPIRRRYWTTLIRKERAPPAGAPPVSEKSSVKCRVEAEPT
jgi:hypothetical protein